MNDSSRINQDSPFHCFKGEKESVQDLSSCAKKEAKNPTDDACGQHGLNDPTSQSGSRLELKSSSATGKGFPSICTVETKPFDDDHPEHFSLHYCFTESMIDFAKCHYIGFDHVKKQVFKDWFNYRRSSLRREHDRWLMVFKRMFSDLAEQSDRKKKTIDKETFLDYFPLPGVLGERLFDLFDTNKSHSIDFYEFCRGLGTIYNGSLEEKKKFLFDMYDLDNNGSISRAELSTLLSHITVAFKVLHHLAQLGTTWIPQKLPWTKEDLMLHNEHARLEKNVNFLVQSIFSHISSSSSRLSSTYKETNEKSAGHLSEHYLSGYNAEKAELTFSEFCDALERNKEISDVLDLFYQDAMPDSPIPVEMFAEPLLKKAPHLSPQPSGEGGRFWKSKPGFLKKIQSWFNMKKTPHRIDHHGESNLSASQHKRTSKKDPMFSLLNTERAKSPSSSSWFNEKIMVPIFNRESDSCIALSGWLYKVGRKFHLKCYRFYVLRDQFLYYFTSQTTRTPCNVMFLRGASITPACVTDKNHSSFAFDIELAYHRGRVKRVFAKDRESLNQWVRALSRAACTGRFHEEYLLQTFVASGKFGVVYKGLEKKTQQPVAVKIIRKFSDNQNRQNKSFLRTEICILWLTQQHPNIVQLIDVHESSQHIYVVIEWLPDGDLASFMKHFEKHENHACLCCLPGDQTDGEPREITTQVLVEKVAWTVVKGVLEGLICLHHHNVIHRDLKPENILLVTRRSTCFMPSSLAKDHHGLSALEAKSALTDPCALTRPTCPCRSCWLCCFIRSLVTVKLTDFGLSAILNPQGFAQEPLGTFCYAAPEVLRGHPYGKPVDLWSLGVLTYQILSGYRQLPFSITSERGLADSILSCNFSFEPHSYWDHISSDAKDFVSRLLEKNAALRSTAQEAVDHPWLKTTRVG